MARAETEHGTRTAADFRRAPRRERQRDCNAAWLPLRVALATLTVFALSLASCTGAGNGDEPLGVTRGAVVTTLSITGQVQDANGLGIGGVTVTLAGSASKTKLTDANGNYAFTGLAAGSYSLRPTRTGCAFTPDVVNLNNITSSKVQYFASSGSNCGGSTNVNAGATSGAFTISGVLTDGSGKKIVGGRVNLGGSSTAVRFSDFSGRYTFHVNAGSYTLSAAGACSLTPASATFNNLNGNRSQDFSGSGPSCVASATSNLTAAGQVAQITQASTKLGLTFITIEQRANAADALARLQSIVDERPGTVRSLVIGGNSAIEREAAISVAEVERGKQDALGYGITTAVAVGSKVVRFESRLGETPTSATINAILLAGRNFGVENIDALHGASGPSLPAAKVTGPLPATPPVTHLPNANADQKGELQIAVSEYSPTAIVGTNPTRGGFSLAPINTHDFGVTLGRATRNTVPSPGDPSSHGYGDPSVGVGAYNGSTNNFYLSDLPLVETGNGSIALFVSSDDGNTFNPAAVPFPVDCNADGPHGSCVAPDQAQLAVDKHNQVNGRDQLYLAWRNFAQAGADGETLSIELACSPDAGQSWHYDALQFTPDLDDYPRLAIAQDGSLLVAFARRVNPDDQSYTLFVQRFNRCGDSVPLGKVYSQPLQIAIPTEPSNMAGMPRQPRANYSVAAGESSAGADKMYVTYVGQTSPGNDDVYVATASIAAGTASGPAQGLNDDHTGHRYFPAICTTQDLAFIAWYDRRKGDDRTAYFRRTLLNDGGALGSEYNVTGDGHEDPQCLAGFGQGASAPEAETLCTDLPLENLNVGTCQLDACCDGCSAGDANYCTQTGCDFRAGVPGSTCSAAGETCRVRIGTDELPGDPVFGDYNGIGCGQGRAILAWAATSAPVNGLLLNGAACTTDSQCDSGVCNMGACFRTKGVSCLVDGAACSGVEGCCSGNCAGGVCLHAIGVYVTAAVPKAVKVHADCHGDVTVTDNVGNVTPYSKDQSFDVLVGADAANYGSFSFQPDPIGASSVSAGFALQPDGVSVRSAGFGYVIGEELVNTGAVDPIPATGAVLSGATSGGMDPGSFPLVSGTLSFSCSLTVTLQP